MNKFEVCLLIGSSILIILYIVVLIFDSVITAKGSKTYQKYVETIQEQNLLLTNDINVTNEILELLLQKINDDKKENNDCKGEENNEKNV